MLKFVSTYNRQIRKDQFIRTYECYKLLDKMKITQEPYSTRKSHTDMILLIATVQVNSELTAV